MSKKLAVITGGGSGIGRATADRLREDGFRLAILDLDGASAAEAAGEGLGLAVDVTDPEAVDSAFVAIEEQLGPVDVLVNNAGIAGGKRLHETALEEWDKVMAVNVRGLYLCSRAALASMVRQRSGHVITLSSVSGMVPLRARSVYTVSKAAALMLAKSIAIDYAADGIRSNAVCPGVTETPQSKWRLDQPDLRAEVEARIPMGRVARPEEIADAIAMLASDRLGYMTGHGLVVDGGWTIA